MKMGLQTKSFQVISLLLLFAFTSCGQKQNTNSDVPVGGGCDGCELMYEDMPEKILATDTSAGWNEEGQKLLVTGTIYNFEGKIPAPNVIVYYWQTDNNGYYSSTEGMNEKVKSHGHIRGWIKSDENGKYSIYTIRPAPYPSLDMPAHIHLSIKEPDIGNEYYPDDINFDDDELLIPYFKKYPQENRCGSGVVRVLLKDDLQIAEHNIVLGLNIPNYPKKQKLVNPSGLSVGEDQPSFTPYHAYGPDKGTHTCPVCKYGRYHGILYFVGNNSNWREVKDWLRFLEQESIKRRKYLKVYFVYGGEESFSKETRERELEQIGQALRIKNVALTFVPSFKDEKTEVNLNKINPMTENTFIIYKHRTIIDKYIDLKPTPSNFSRMSSILDKTRGDFFDLSEPNRN